MISRMVAATSAFLFACTVLQAQANMIETCSGTQVKWRIEPPRFRASGLSFPAGSSWTTALKEAVGLWNRSASNFRFDLTLDDWNIGLGNGQSEVWFTDDPELTRIGTAFAMPWYFGCTNIVEVDIVFDHDAPWTTSDSKGGLYVYGGQSWLFSATVVHEFGHGLGLQHENRFYNNMGVDNTVLITNGTAARAYVGADATGGAVRLYGKNAAVLPDISISHWKWVGTHGEYSVHGRTEVFLADGSVATNIRPAEKEPLYDVPNGGSIFAEFTYENNGAQDVDSVPITFFLSSDDSIGTTDRAVATHVIGLPSLSLGTVKHMIWLPNDLVQNHTYFLGAKADVAGAVGEFEENNNATYVALRIVQSTPAAVLLNPAIVAPGQPSSGRVVLNGAAPAGGAFVTLQSADGLVATVPPSVTVPAGAWVSPEFPITTYGASCASYHADINAFRGGARASAELVVQPPIAVGKLCTAKFDWDKYWYFPFACFGFEPGLGAPNPTGNRTCRAPAGCPECIFALDGKVLKMNPQLRDLYASLNRFATAGTLKDSADALKGARRNLEAAPTGAQYTDAMRRNVLKLVDGTSEKRVDAGVVGAVVEAMNALEVDQRAPAPASSPLREGAAAASYGKALRISAHGVAKAGTLTVAVKSGVPAATHSFEPLWPVLSYEMGFTGGLVAESTADVVVNLQGFDSASSPSNLRLMQWTGDSYRDITTVVDVAN